MDSNISPDLESAADSIREGNDWIVYPVTVCDNFYEDPDSVREFALSLDYTNNCLLYTSPSPRDRTRSRMPSSA